MPSNTLSDIVKAYDVRGLVPGQFDTRKAAALGRAFAETVVLPEAAGSPRAAVGHDMRDSSPALARAFAEGMSEAGAQVIHIGLASTDQTYFASGSLDLPAAMFTASHNPAAYNGIKICRAGARPVSRESGLEAIRERAEELLAQDRPTPQSPPQSPSQSQSQSSGRIENRDVLADYARFLRGLVDLSDARPLTVVVDAGNGMGGHTVPAVLGTGAGLAELPLTILPLYFELDGTFPNHEANPLDPKNLLDLQAAVLAHGADLGIAFDGDADRCFVVDERGAPVSPSAITAMIAMREVAKEIARGTPASDVAIVHNLICSRAVPEVIDEVGARAVRTRVGHSFIKADMASHRAVFGGEHSAHYYFRDFWFADTGMLAAMHVLAALGEQDAPLSSLMARFDRYAASGEINSTVTDVPAAVAAVREWAADREVTEDDLDGLTLTHVGDGTAADPLWWLSLRASNTEPLLRLNVEAATPQLMSTVRDEVLRIVRGEKPARGENP